MVGPRIMAVLLVLVACLMAWVIWRGQTAEQHAFLRADKAACVRIEKLKSLARVQIERSIKTLPTLAYYRQHPDELADALFDSRRYLGEFAPTKC